MIKKFTPQKRTIEAIQFADKESAIAIDNMVRSHGAHGAQATYQSHRRNVVIRKARQRTPITVEMGDWVWIDNGIQTASDEQFKAQWREKKKPGPKAKKPKAKDDEKTKEAA